LPEQIKSVTDAGLAKFDVDAAAAVVREAYFRHLKP
jgi:hypothetical protein